MNQFKETEKYSRDLGKYIVLTGVWVASIVIGVLGIIMMYGFHWI